MPLTLRTLLLVGKFLPFIRCKDGFDYGGTCSGQCSRILHCGTGGSEEGTDFEECRRLYGSDYRQGSFRDPRVHLHSFDTALNLTSYKSVVDLRCTSNFRGYFHLIWNCLVPFVPAFLHSFGDGAVWLSEPQLQRFLLGLQLLPPNHTVIMSPHRRRIPFVFAHTVHRAFPPKPVNYFSLPNCAACFRSIVANSLELKTNSHGCFNRSILYLWRGERHGRNQPGYEQLLYWLEKAFPLLNVRIFFGNETVREMVGLFHSAKVVVGPHGAAFANIVFAQEDAIAIEVTRERKEGQLWRTNIGVMNAVGVKGIVYKLKYRDLAKALGKTTLREGLLKSSPLPLNESDSLSILAAISSFCSSCWSI